ncbi:MAG: hypothetical protein ACLP1X_24415 [Polyangiaceae bacterium]
MKHVFVETNWVFEFCAPAHRSTPEAQELASRAARGDLVLHVPAVSLREGANAIQQKCQPKANKELQEFRRWAEANGKFGATTAGEAKTFLDAYVNSVNADMGTLEDRVDAIKARAGVAVFALDQRMLDRAIALRREVATLKPFDEAILAAILIKAGDVRAAATELFFCDLDGDLVPIDRKGKPRKELVALYDAAGITVRQDFLVP